MKNRNNLAGARGHFFPWLLRLFFLIPLGLLLSGCADSPGEKEPWETVATYGSRPDWGEGPLGLGDAIDQASVFLFFPFELAGTSQALTSSRGEGDLPEVEVFSREVRGGAVGLWHEHLVEMMVPPHLPPSPETMEDDEGGGMDDNPAPGPRTPQDQLQDLYRVFLEHRGVNSSAVTSPAVVSESPRDPDPVPEPASSDEALPVLSENPGTFPAESPEPVTEEKAEPFPPAADPAAPAALVSEEGALNQDDVEKLLQLATENLPPIDPEPAVRPPD